MGECIISRHGGGDSTSIEPLQAVAGQCMIRLKIVDSTNKGVESLQVNCKDGSRWYNYITNSKGMVLFSTNSGSANITINNIYQNNTIIGDYGITNINYAAPVGTVKDETVKFTKLTSMELNKAGNGNIVFVSHGTINMIEISGGGAGGSALCYTFSGGSSYLGGPGRPGYTNNIKTYFASKLQKYPYIIGAGGMNGTAFTASQAVAGSNERANSLGKAGGTTTFLGMSAAGGTVSAGGNGAPGGARANSTNWYEANGNIYGKRGSNGWIKIVF